MCGGNSFPLLWDNIPKDSLDYAPDTIPASLLKGSSISTPPAKGSNKNEPELNLLFDWSIQSKIGQVSI